jgi:hypothetical protein
MLLILSTSISLRVPDARINLARIQLIQPDPQLASLIPLMLTACRLIQALGGEKYAERRRKNDPKRDAFRLITGPHDCQFWGWVSGERLSMLLYL